MSKRRAAVRNNLKIVNAWLFNQVQSGGESQRVNKQTLSFDVSAFQEGIPRSQSMPLEAQVSEVFQRAGANLFSGFTFSCMSPEQVACHLEINGLEHLEAALSRGKGAIALLAHMGPWEALTQLPGFAMRKGIEAPFGAMYRPLNNAYLENWFKAQRETGGMHLFSRVDGFHKPVDFIRGGGILGILADQKMRQGVEVPYFGMMSKTNPLPGLFYRRSGAGVISLSIETIGVAKWRMRINRIEHSVLDLAQSREAFSTLCNQQLEEVISRSVCDAFLFSGRFGKNKALKNVVGD